MGEEVVEWGTMPGNLGARSSETSFLILRPILLKSAVVIFRQQFKTFDSNNFTLSSTFSVQNAWTIKIKAVYTLLLSFSCENRMGSQLAYFLKQII